MPQNILAKSGLNYVPRTFRVRVGKVDGRRYDAVSDNHNADCSFNSAGTADEVPGH